VCFNSQPRQNIFLSSKTLRELWRPPRLLSSGGWGAGVWSRALIPSSIEVRNEWSLTATHSRHAHARHIILCEISKAKAWRTFYQQLCCWMHSTNSAVC
jgi:hypothetical protein